MDFGVFSPLRFGLLKLIFNNYIRFKTIVDSFTIHNEIVSKQCQMPPIVDFKSCLQIPINVAQTMVFMSRPKLQKCFPKS